MDWLQVVVLSLLQGITEFLPISSSAHLILTPQIFAWPDQGLTFDVAVHVGTLIAVVFYFRTELQRMAGSCLTVANGGSADQEALLAARVMVATVPSTLIGAIFHDKVETVFRDPLVIATATIVFGLALLLANHERKTAGNEYQLGFKIAIGIGLAQMLAFIPGTSRSGITMMAGVLLGLRRDSAAKFSFLMSIPLILGAGIYKTVLLVQSGQIVDWQFLISGMLLSAISALICIHLFLSVIERMGFTPFVVYRLALGAVLLFIFV